MQKKLKHIWSKDLDLWGNDSVTWAATSAATAPTRVTVKPPSTWCKNFSLSDVFTADLLSTITLLSCADTCRFIDDGQQRFVCSSQHFATFPRVPQCERCSGHDGDPITVAQCVAYVSIVKYEKSSRYDGFLCSADNGD